MPLQHLFPRGFKCPVSWFEIPLTAAQAPLLRVERFGCGTCGLQFCSIPELVSKDGSPEFFSLCEMKHDDGDSKHDFLRGGVFAMNNSTNQVAFVPSSWKGRGDGAEHFSAHFQVACVMGWLNCSSGEFSDFSLESLHVGRMVAEATLKAEAIPEYCSVLPTLLALPSQIGVPSSVRKTIGQIPVVKNFRKGVAEGLAEIREISLNALQLRANCAVSLGAECVWGGSVQREAGKCKAKWNSGTLQGCYHAGVATSLHDEQKKAVKGADEKQAPEATKQIVEAALRGTGYGVVLAGCSRVMPVRLRYRAGAGSDIVIER